MISTMKESNGVGLIKPQVGDNRRICVVDLGFTEGFVYDGEKVLTDDYYPLVLINPEIKIVSEAKSVMNEGCLSFPALLLLRLNVQVSSNLLFKILKETIVL